MRDLVSLEPQSSALAALGMPQPLGLSAYRSCIQCDSRITLSIHLATLCCDALTVCICDRPREKGPFDAENVSIYAGFCKYEAMPM